MEFEEQQFVALLAAIIFAGRGNADGVPGYDPSACVRLARGIVLMSHLVKAIDEAPDAPENPEHPAQGGLS